MGFRFLHAADLHLDSPFTGLAAAAPVEVAEMLRDATFGSWRRIVDLAIEQRVDFVLVAGDVFESANRTLLAQVRFRDGLVQLSDARIPSFVVTGNHDPLSGWEPSVAWPPLAYRFPAHEVTSVPVRRGGGEAEPELARIHGISFHVRDVTENLALRFRSDPGAPFSIGLLHANVGSNPAHAPYSPGSIDDLRAAGLDYWALGHIHKPAILSEGNPAIVYAGNSQGRDPIEADARGCMLVSVRDDGVPRVEHRATDVVRWQLIDLQIDSIDGDEALIDAVAGAAAGARDTAGRSIIARVTLRGRGPLHESLRRPRYLEDLRATAQERLGLGRPFAWLESIRDATRPVVDIASLRGGSDFVGGLLREIEGARAGLLDAARGGTQAPAGDELRMALEPLFERSRGRGILRDAAGDPANLVRLLDEAETLLVDRLTSEQ